MDDRLRDLIAKIPKTTLGDFPALIDSAFRLGRQVERERFQDGLAKMADAFRALNINFDGTPAVASVPAATPRAPKSDKSSIIDLVRTTLRSCASDKHGTGAHRVRRLIQQSGSKPGITLLQVRSALKTLYRQNEITRVGRGNYRMKPDIDSASQFENSPAKDETEAEIKPNGEATPIKQEAGPMFSGTA